MGKIQKITKSTVDGSVTIAGNNAQVILSAIDTVALSGSYAHELRITDAENLSEVVAIGVISIASSLTR